MFDSLFVAIVMKQVAVIVIAPFSGSKFSVAGNVVVFVG
jgi:hypothetical protein